MNYNFSVETIKDIDGLFEWLFISLNLLQATLFQFFTWFVGAPNGSVYFIIKLMGATLFPPMVILLIWIYSHLIDNEDLSLFLRFLSWSMSTIYIYVWMMLCALYTKVELNMLFPFIGNIISSILFVSMAGISYIITLKVIRTYHKLTTKSSYWKRKGNTHVPILCGIFLTYIITDTILSLSH